MKLVVWIIALNALFYGGCYALGVYAANQSTVNIIAADAGQYLELKR